MSELKIGDKLWTEYGLEELTVYEIGARTIKAAAGGKGGYPDFTVGKKSLVPVGKWSRYGALLRPPEAREKQLARIAGAWISQRFECGEIAPKDVLRVARMLGWKEGK